jgi:DGQHR domain-containing protein
MLHELIVIDCLRGQSAGRLVLLGFARADLLFRLSFPDVLNEATGEGYQRPFNERHSLDFRRYIQESDSSTIPLTLNLRPLDDRAPWRLVELENGRVRLEIDACAEKIMAQVDCQHRLGHLGDLPVSLPFMCFIGLSVREEMEVFSIINGKAKGLSASLLDYHESQLAEDLARDRPELYIALQLNTDETSPWCRQLNLGGKPTLGLKRIASLRMMQQAVSDFLKSTRAIEFYGPEKTSKIVTDFWKAVAAVLPKQWKDTRRHMLTKGIGVYALMHIAADICNENNDAGRVCDKRSFASALNDFAGLVDWSTGGSLKGYGGQAGVKAAVEYIRGVRARARYKVVNG